MPFVYRDVISRAYVAPFFDTSPGEFEEKLQIQVKRAEVPEGQPRWEAICGYILTKAESGGNPNVYLNAVNALGQVEHKETTGRTMVFGWDWEGRREGQRHDPVRGEKPLSEPSANINLGSRQVVKVWVIDDIPSDEVSNLRSDHPAHVFHISSFVCFKRSTGGVIVPTEPPVVSGCEELQIAYDILKAQRDDYLQRLRIIEGIAKGT